MANINNLRIGDVIPDTLMLDKPYIKEYGDELIKDYYKYANDAGGYYVHGLWLAPGHEDGVYWWPWDLGVAGGALKDVNDGWARWGYVQDGENKNITSGMNNSFPDNGWGTSNWNVVLCIYGNSTGNSTIGSNSAYDFTECPIVIKFSEDFISGATVDILNSADVDVSEDGTTFTINKLKVNDRVIKFTWTDTSLSFIRQKLTNVIVDVTGLDYHYQGVKSEVDYSSVEVWDAYIGDTQVYHKDKTVENCLEKYKYCKYVFDDAVAEDYQYQIAKDSSMTANNIIVPIPIDFDSLFGLKQSSFNIVASNTEFWDAVKENAQNIGLIICNSSYAGGLKGVFQNSNISGAITIKLLNGGNIAGDRMFENTLLNEINFTYDTNIVGDAKNQFTSINTLFKNTPNLKTITSPKDLLARDMSGCFEGSGIEEIPGIILYSSRTYNEIKGANPYCSITQYFCNSCSKLTIINRYRGATNREDYSNLIKFQSAYYSFNNCSQLVTIDPILDFEYVRPSESQNAFNNCSKLTDVRIRNLNHGDWHLDNNAQQGNLSALNQASIEYLFANLKDLTTRDPDLVFSGGNDGDEGWNGNTFAANPDVSAANLYCPSSWDSYITSEMISAANAKGWTIYVGGSVKSI